MHAPPFAEHEAKLWAGRSLPLISMRPAWGRVMDARRGEASSSSHASPGDRGAGRGATRAGVAPSRFRQAARTGKIPRYPVRAASPGGQPGRDGPRPGAGAGGGGGGRARERGGAGWGGRGAGGGGGCGGGRRRGAAPPPFFFFPGELIDKGQEETIFV